MARCSGRPALKGLTVRNARFAIHKYITITLLRMHCLPSLIGLVIQNILPPGTHLIIHASPTRDIRWPIRPQYKAWREKGTLFECSSNKASLCKNTRATVKRQQTQPLTCETACRSSAAPTHELHPQLSHQPNITSTQVPTKRLIILQVLSHWKEAHLDIQQPPCGKNNLANREKVLNFALDFNSEIKDTDWTQ